MIKNDYQTILQSLRTKESKGLELLYERYGRPFFRYGVDRWRLNEEQVWEIVYKTLEILVLKLPGYEFASQGKFDAFVFTVYTNFLRQHLREVRSKNMPETEFFDLEQEFVLPVHVREALTKQAFAEFYASETTDHPMILAIRQVLEQLPPDDRDLLLLRAQNYSYEEIGELLGLADKQLKVKHFRAKEKLVKLLNESK